MALISHIFLLFAAASLLQAHPDKPTDSRAENLKGKALIDYVNSQQNLWKAGPTKLDAYPEHVRRGLLGVKHVRSAAKERENLSPTRFLGITIPTHFDSREQWPECESIKSIRDQSACGSCWAFGAVEAMSDRICIVTKGTLQVSLSSDDLLSCCIECGFGCEGGEPIIAWEYWMNTGIVTGSNYTTNSGCRPYPLAPCEHHNNKTHFKPCMTGLYHTPKCDWQCQSNYQKSYFADKYYGKTANYIEPTVEAIQKEIITNGPVEASFDVFSDFLSYTGGIYKHTGGTPDGGHAVKIIGWGVENKVPYWTIANSWNSDWGENGFFRMLRGADECGIESGITAGLPKL